MMGNFNHGPTKFPYHYDYITALGYYSPYVVMDGRCTLCKENPSVIVPSRIVDHIYVPVNSSFRVQGVKVRI